MKTIYNLLLTSGLLATQFVSNASAQQCQTYPGHFNHSPVVSPVADRYHHFQIDGRGFSFDRQTNEIFCGGVKIGLRTPEGQVQLLPDATSRISGAAGAPVGQPGAVVQPGAAGQPAGGPAVGAPAPSNGAPAPGAPAGGAAPATGAPAPAGAPVGAPIQAGPAPTATTAIPGAIPSLGNGINPTDLFVGQWRAENKNILGRNVVRELTFNDDKNLTLRVQAAGEEAQVIEGGFELKDGNLNVKGGDENRELGLVAAENGQLVLRGAETLTFKRVTE